MDLNVAAMIVKNITLVASPLPNASNLHRIVLGTGGSGKKNA